jgi:hypothetical protein
MLSALPLAFCALSRPKFNSKFEPLRTRWPRSAAGPREKGKAGDWLPIKICAFDQFFFLDAEETLSEDEEQPAKPKKAKSGDDKQDHNVVNRWADSMSEEEKEATRGTAVVVIIDHILASIESPAKRGHKALNQYQKDKAKIPFDLQCLMKLVLEFLPECWYNSRDLVLHIFNTSSGTNPCVFHSLKQAGRKEICDGNGKYIVNGVPFPAARLAGDNTKNNALSCGCWVDDALLGFLFFKNMVATSRNWKIP